MHKSVDSIFLAIKYFIPILKTKLICDGYILMAMSALSSKKAGGWSCLISTG